MADITEDIRNFLSARQEFERRSRQIAAFRLATGIDLSAALAAEGEEKAKFIRRLGRLIERERLRGVKRHWSYDVNRHIALKQVLDELCGRPARQQPTGIAKWRAKRTAAPEAPPSRKRVMEERLSASCACGPAPSSWRVANAPGHSSARPSGSSNRGPTSRGTGPA